MIPATNDLVCEWLKVKWCRTQVKNPISVFQIKKKSSIDFLSVSLSVLKVILAMNPLLEHVTEVSWWRCSQNRYQQISHIGLFAING
jgi:hypothetical protein